MLLHEPCLLSLSPVWPKLPSHQASSSSSFSLHRDLHWTPWGPGNIWLVLRIWPIWAAVPLHLLKLGVRSSSYEERHQQWTHSFLFQVFFIRLGVRMSAERYYNKRNAVPPPEAPQIIWLCLSLLQHCNEHTWWNSSMLCVTQPRSAPKVIPRRISRHLADLWLNCLQRK